MQTIHAIYENGVFRPIEPVELPELCEVVFEPRELIDLGDRVVVLQREQRRGRHSGVEIQADTASVLWLRDGKVWRCQGYMDQAEALEAVGLPDRAGERR